MDKTTDITKFDINDEIAFNGSLVLANSLKK